MTSAPALPLESFPALVPSLTTLSDGFFTRNYKMIKALHALEPNNMNLD